MSGSAREWLRLRFLFGCKDLARKWLRTSEMSSTEQQIRPSLLGVPLMSRRKAMSNPTGVLSVWIGSTKGMFCSIDLCDTNNETAV